MAVKDIFCVAGEVTTAGSRILENFRSPYSATVVHKLEDAGAVIIGKTNMDEFAMGSSCENSAFFPTRNPWDTTRVPGGSSGGSASTVGAGTVPIALGTDTGGSIREPASFCNIVGVKPTYGRVSRYGLIAFASSLDQAGPMTADVRDAAQTLEVIAGHDPLDSTSIDAPVPKYSTLLRSNLAGIRVGIVAEFEEQIGKSDPALAALYKAAYADLERLGAQLVEVRLPHARYGLATYYLIAPAECSSNLARYDGTRYGCRVDDGGDVFQMFERTRAAGFGDEVKRRVILGTYALSAGYYDAYYGRAQKIRTLIKRDFDDAFATCDVIACPAVSCPPFEFGRQDCGSSRDVSHGLFHDSDELGRHSRAFRAGRLCPRPPRWFTDRGAGVRRSYNAWHRARLRASDATCIEANAAGCGGSCLVSARVTAPEQMVYEPVIGLEVHVELSTKSKMFCGCRNEFGAEPNTLVCPICLGMPGTLPVINARAVEYLCKTGIALGCSIASHSKFDRKNYFYPDMPKNYQISQYDMPLTTGGGITLPSGKIIRLNRIHLEEDTGKNVHAGGRMAGAEYTLIDYNRAGVPLMEIVTEPDIASPQEAEAYLVQLKAVLSYLGVSDVKMHEGSLRCDANVSIRPVGSTSLGTKAEVKNMNSFRSVVSALRV